MEYFYNKKKKSTAAHLWNDGDTFCTLLSTGGMMLGAKKPHKDPDGKRICVMCQVNFKKTQKK